MKKKFGIPPPEDQQRELSEADVDALERNLRLAAGAFYEVDEIQPPEHKSWMKNKPPGIVRRFNAIRDALLPPRKHKET